MFLANWLSATSVSCLYGDLWHPVSLLKVLLSPVIGIVYYAENKSTQWNERHMKAILIPRSFVYFSRASEWLNAIEHLNNTSPCNAMRSLWPGRTLSIVSFTSIMYARTKCIANGMYIKHVAASPDVAAAAPADACCTEAARLILLHLSEPHLQPGH